MKYYVLHDLASLEFQNPWLVQDFLPNTGWTLVVGDAGIGKSTFALQLCDAITRGAEFFGKPTMQTLCVYIQADGSELEWQEIVKRVVPNSPAGTIVNVPRGILEDDGGLKQLYRLIAHLDPGFVVWDSLYKLTNVNINTNAVMKSIGAIETVTLFRPWMLIHHPSKDSMGGVHGSSGHGSLAAACSTYLTMKKTKITVEKARLMREGDIQTKRDPEGRWMLKEDSQERIEEMSILAGVKV